MPIGSYAAVPELVQALLRQRPQSLLDLGIGFGGGGVLVREWLDLGVQPWKTYLAGVECWEAYRNPCWDLYNVIHVKTIEQFLNETSERFDCILLCDVLEHFERPRGAQLLDALPSFVAPGGSLLITTPAKFFSQGAVYGNERERHRSAWQASDFSSRHFHVQSVGRPDYWCGSCWLARWPK